MSSWIVGRAPRYLGDGVYASIEADQIWLQTMEGSRIALESQVFDALIAYDKDMREKAKGGPG